MCDAAAYLRGRGKVENIFQVERWLEKHKPKVLLLENVPFTMYSKSSGETENLSHIRSALESRGYHVHTLLLNSRDYAIPQNRLRIWIVGVLRSCVQGPGNNIQSIVDTMRLDVLISLEHFLLSSKRPVYRGRRHRGGKKRKWEQAHATYFQAVRCSVSMNALVVELQELLGLIDREASVLNFHVNMGAFKGSHVLLDLKHSVQRTKAR